MKDVAPWPRRRCAWSWSGKRLCNTETMFTMNSAWHGPTGPTGSDAKCHLVGGFNLPLRKIWKSVGIVIPNIWEKKHVPNHQSAITLNIIAGEAARHGLSVRSDRKPRAKQNKARCHRSRMVPTAVNGELRLSPKMCSVYSPSPATHKDGTGRNRCDVPAADFCCPNAGSVSTAWQHRSVYR